MTIVNSSQTVYVGWRYDNPELSKLLAFFDITESEAREMTKPELAKKLELEGLSLPQPLITHCILLDVTDEKNRKVIATEYVRKHKNDAFDKDESRRYSLAKTLHAAYPGLENKELRRKFWEGYLNRKPQGAEVVSMAVVMKN